MLMVDKMFIAIMCVV